MSERSCLIWSQIYARDNGIISIASSRITSGTFALILLSLRSTPKSQLRAMLTLPSKTKGCAHLLG